MYRKTIFTELAVQVEQVPLVKQYLSSALMSINNWSILSV
jgi:hypothetical protein